jgi:hypothetical protein
MFRRVSSDSSFLRNWANCTTLTLPAWILEANLCAAMGGRFFWRLSNCAMACPVGCSAKMPLTSFELSKYCLLCLRTWRIILWIIALTESSFSFRRFSLSIFATRNRNSLKSSWVSQDFLASSKIFQHEEVSDGTMERQESGPTNVWVNALIPFHMVIQEQLRE